MKKYKADIEDVETREGMTIEFWAKDEAQAKEKLYWLLGKNYTRDWDSLELLEEK